MIEVADTTTEFDRNEKLPRYAAVGVAETWLVNVADRCIEQYTQPRNGAYQIRRVRRQGDTLEAAVLPGLALPVAQIFA